MEKDTNSILNNVTSSQVSHGGEHVAGFDAFNATESAAITASTFSRKVQRERANAQDKLNDLIATDAKHGQWIYIEWYLSNDEAWQLATTASPENPRKSIEYALITNGYHWTAGDASGDEPQGHWSKD